MDKENVKEIKEINNENMDKIFNTIEEFSFIGSVGYKGSKMGFFSNSGNWVLLESNKLKECLIRHFEGELKEVKLFFDVGYQGEKTVSIDKNGLVSIRSNYAENIGFDISE